MSEMRSNRIERLGAVSFLVAVGLAVVFMLAGRISGTDAIGGSGNAVAASEQRALVIRDKALDYKHARAQDCMTGAELRALTIRSEALNRRYGLGTSSGRRRQCTTRLCPTFHTRA